MPMPTITLAGVLGNLGMVPVNVIAIDDPPESEVVHLLTLVRMIDHLPAVVGGDHGMVDPVGTGIHITDLLRQDGAMVHHHPVGVDHHGTEPGMDPWAEVLLDVEISITTDRHRIFEVEDLRHLFEGHHPWIGVDVVRRHPTEGFLPRMGNTGVVEEDKGLG